MEGDTDVTCRKWKTVKEQLISLSSFNEGAKGNEDLKEILTEDVCVKNINSQVFATISYFLLGVIDAEERDKLIKWPLINIQTQTKFRKGLTSMVSNFQEKYSWANVKKLPESYFANPHGQQKKLVNFLLRLTNLAIHVTLKDPELLVMHSGNHLSGRDVDIMREIISKARQKEERLMKENVFSLEEFELTKNALTDKCVAVNEENSKLQKHINNLLTCAVQEKIIETEQNGMEKLNIIKERKLIELNDISRELSKYNSAGNNLLNKLKSIKNPLTLTSNDFNCENLTSNIKKSTLQACEDWNRLQQNIASKEGTEEEEEKFYDLIKQAQNTLKAENKSLKLVMSCSFMSNNSGAT